MFVEKITIEREIGTCESSERGLEDPLTVNSKGHYINFNVILYSKLLIFQLGSD